MRAQCTAATHSIGRAWGSARAWGSERARGAGRARWRDDHGTVTAEFAVVVPAVLVVLGLVIGGIVIATNRLTLAAAAADIARLEARGDDTLAAERVTAAGPGVGVERARDGALLCITLRASPVGGPLAALSLTGTGCAAVTDEAERF
ncbi:TadE/TadG family type IV pilus assembly protein [Leucobacter sp. HY1910]